MAQKGTNEISGPQLVILSNPNSADYFENIKYELAKNLEESETFKELESVKNANDRDVRYRTLSSRKELNGFLNNDNLSNAGPFFFLITVELYWDNTAYQGYKVVLEDLMHHEELREELHLHFTSFISRLDLSKQCEDRQKKMAEYFPQHFQLPYQRVALPEEEEGSEESKVLMDNTDNLLELKPMLTSRWNWLRKNALKRWGILDDLAHKIGEQIDEKIINQIKGIPDIAGKEILNKINNIGANEFSEKQQRELKRLLTERANEILEDEVTDTTKSGYKPKLVVVEDKDNFRKKLDERFSKDFELKLFASGEKAIAYIEENSMLVDGVISDFELLDENGLHQDAHGINVVEYVKRRHPYLILKIFTHLPRRSIRELLNSVDIKYNDVVFKEFIDPGKPENENHIKDFIHSLRYEIDEAVHPRDLKGPGRILWKNTTKGRGKTPGRLTWFYHDLKKKPNEKFDKMWSEIDDYMEKLELLDKDDKGIDFGFGRSGDWNYKVEGERAECIKFMKKILIHRYFWLKKVYTGVEPQDFELNKYEKYFAPSSRPFKSKQFSHYGMLTGTTFSETSPGRIDLTFKGELLDEEKERLRKYGEAFGKEIDVNDAFISDEIYDILNYIEDNDSHRGYRQEYMQSDKFHELWAGNKLTWNNIEDILHTLGKEKPTDSFNDLRVITDIYHTREEVIKRLETLKGNNEYHSYSNKIQELLTEAFQTLNSDQVEK